jgi:dipeptidyl aminopeptidase/acylaminoacyl peptidase
LLVLAPWVPSAHATFPGQNGKIAYGWDEYNCCDEFPEWSGVSTWPGEEEVDRGYWSPNGGTNPDWSPDGTKLASSLRICSGCPNGIRVAEGSSRTTIIDNPSDSWYPSWSPGGMKIAFASYRDGNYDIYSVNADGTGEVRLTNDPGADSQPAWSPDGSKIAFVSYRDGNHEIYAMNPDGSAQTNLTHTSSARESVPDWSPDGEELVYEKHDIPGGEYGIWRMNPDGSGQRLAELRETIPTWSPDGSMIAFVHLDAEGGSVRTTAGTFLFNPQLGPESLSWQPVPAPGYARPKGATPMYASLVPAYNPCSSANRTHGPPLTFGSCSSPTQSSSQLTVGSPDANGPAANSVGFAKYDVVAGVPGGSDDANVRFTFNFTDVRVQGTLDDYTGQLQATTSAQITDRLNGSTKAEPATVNSVEFPITVPCAPAASTTVGSTCSISTSFDAVNPGAVTESKRSIWQLDRIRVNDGGADGLASTTPNTLFAVQGIFVP